MNTTKKVRILSYLVFLVIFLIVWAILDVAFERLETSYKGIISAVVAVVISPRIHRYKTQSGLQLQLKWIFLKKAISI